MRSVRRLHSDESGSVMVYFMLAAVSLTLLVISILNTGRAVSQRIEVQNAADAAAITQANWTARALNTIAMNNTAMVQLLAVNSTANALAFTAGQAIPAIAKAGRTAQNVASACWSGCGAFPPACLACIAPQAQAIGAGVAGVNAGIMLGYGVDAGIDSAELALAFSDMNDHMVEMFPEFVGEISAEVAVKNDVEGPILHPPTQDSRAQQQQLASTDLPVQVASIFAGTGSARGQIDLCATGSKGTIAPFFSENFKSHYKKYNLGPLKVSQEELSKSILEPGWGFLWYLKFLTPWVTDKDFVLEPLGGNYEQNEGSNLLRARSNQVWGGQCVSSSINFRALHFYELQNRGFVPVTFATPAGDDLRAQMSVIAFVRREDPAPIVKDSWDVAAEHTYAYAQAEVYNVSSLLRNVPIVNPEQPADYGPFTQGWRARLVPATLLERDKQSIDVTEFQTLSNLIDGLDLIDLEQINVH